MINDTAAMRPIHRDTINRDAMPAIPIRCGLSYTDLPLIALLVAILTDMSADAAVRYMGLVEADRNRKKGGE